MSTPAPRRLRVVEDDHHVEISVPWRTSWKLWALSATASLLLGFMAFQAGIGLESYALLGVGVLAFVPLGVVALNHTVVAASREGLIVHTRPFGVWPFHERVWARGAFGFVAVTPWTWNPRDQRSRAMFGDKGDASPWRHMYAVTLEYGDGTNETLVWFVDDVETSDWIRRRLTEHLDGSTSP